MDWMIHNMVPYGSGVLMGVIMTSFVYTMSFRRNPDQWSRIIDGFKERGRR